MNVWLFILLMGGLLIAAVPSYSGIRLAAIWYRKNK